MVHGKSLVLDTASHARATGPTGDEARGAAEGQGDILAYETVVLDRQESTALRKLAGRLEVTANDLLLRDLLTVLARRNLAAGEPQHRLRINVPVNVRTRGEAAMPAANRIGYGFVMADCQDADEPGRLLQVVRGETKRIKDWKLGLYFLGGLAFGRMIPGLLPWMLRRKRSFATAVLSNVGRFVPEAGLKGREDRWQCGDLVLESVGGVPPLRALTRAAAIVIEYAGETSLCLRCDPRYFSRVETLRCWRSLPPKYARRSNARRERGAAVDGGGPRCLRVHRGAAVDGERFALDQVAQRARQKQHTIGHVFGRQEAIAGHAPQFARGK